MEHFFLKFGFSWTFSKVLPYILMLLFGLILFQIIYRTIKKSRIRPLFFSVIILPTIVYFSFFPIYEGDFSNNFQESQLNENLVNLQRGQLNIITIPDCPFCYESLDLIAQFDRRLKQKVLVNFLVCGESEQQLQWYQSKAGENVSVRLVDKNIDVYFDLARGEFPAFVYVDKNGRMKIWSNGDFGALARDWYESHIGS